VRGDKVRHGWTAALWLTIHRKEIADKIEAETKEILEKALACTGQGSHQLKRLHQLSINCESRIKTAVSELEILVGQQNDAIRVMRETLGIPQPNIKDENGGNNVQD
jgi:sRNA-binding carbon storage regulator CsrA